MHAKLRSRFFPKNLSTTFLYSNDYDVYLKGHYSGHYGEKWRDVLLKFFSYMVEIQETLKNNRKRR